MVLQELSNRFLREHYQFFIDGVEAVISKCECGFNASDVYRAVTAGDVFLLWGFESEVEPLGFLVVSRFTDVYTLEEVLGVDIGYHVHGAEFMDVFKEIDELAENLGVDRIEWRSPRLGWKRPADAAGYLSHTTVYTKGVPHG